MTIKVTRVTAVDFLAIGVHGVVSMLVFLDLGYILVLGLRLYIVYVGAQGPPGVEVGVRRQIKTHVVHAQRLVAGLLSQRNVVGECAQEFLGLLAAYRANHEREFDDLQNNGLALLLQLRNLLNRGIAQVLPLVDFLIVQNLHQQLHGLVAELPGAFDRRKFTIANLAVHRAQRMLAQARFQVLKAPLIAGGGSIFVNIGGRALLLMLALLL